MKLGPVHTTTKNRVWCLQKSICKCFSYQFSIFVTLVTLEAHEIFHVTKNNWSRSQNKVTRTRDSCDKEQRILLCDKNCWLPNLIDGIFEVF